MGHSISMADTASADRGGFRGGFGGRGRGRGRGDRGRGRGRGGRGGRGKDEKEWIPVTKLGRLVKDGRIKSLEEIYLFSLPIKEFEIIDFFLGPSLPSATTMDTSVWALSAPKKWPPPSVVPSSWPSSQSFPFVVVSGVTKLDVPIPFLARSLASAVLSG